MSELFHRDDIDVKRLSIETPQQESRLTFDPEKDLPPEFWVKAENQLRQFKEQADWNHLLMNGRYYYCLDPKRMRALIDLDAQLAILMYIRNEGRMLGTAASLLIFPELRSALQPNDEIFNQKKKIGFGAIDSYYVNRLHILKILCPERFHEVYPDTDEHWQRMLAQPSTDPLVQHYSRLRQIDPIRAKDLKLSQEEWREAKDRVRSVPENLFPTDYRLPADLKILAAESVVIDNNGIHITMPETASKQSEASSLPEQRQY